MALFNLYFMVLSICVTCSTSLNILALFPYPAKSHYNAIEPVLVALTERGHKLTVISPFPQKTSLPGYRDINIADDIDVIYNKLNITTYENKLIPFLWAPFKLAGLANDLCLSLRSKEIQLFLKEENKFDLIITEFLNSDCYLGFVHKFNVPFIGVLPNILMPWTNSMFGNPVNPSYIPTSFAPVSNRMSFTERLLNTFVHVFGEIVYKLYTQYPAHAEAKKHFGQDLPPLDDIANNCSLILVNSHFSLNFPRPMVPNVIEVGGMFVSKPKKLPKNIEKFISESKHGVIFMSMGSMLKGNSFSVEKRYMFLKVFSKLKQNILWKYESDMPNQPSNVMIQKWLPQSDVLCHPNVVAFISHGGQLSSTETVHCGKPVVVLPQYGDQFPNSKALEANNVGVILNLAELTEEQLTQAVNKVLEPSFRKRAKKLSDVFKDRPMSAMDTAIYWVEYVARHGDTSHMKSAAIDLPLYQYLLLDVTLFIVVCLLAILFVIYYILKLIISILFRKKCKENTKTKKVKNN